MKLVVMLGQLLLAVVIVALLMPMVLGLVPAARSATLGPVLLACGVLAIFAVMRVLWPRPRP